MSLASAIHSYLLAEGAFTTVFGTRLFVEAAPETVTTFPYCVYQMGSPSSEHDLGAAAGVTRQRVTFWVYADTSLKVANGIEALRQEFDGFQHALMGTENLDVRTVKIVGGDSVYLPSQIAKGSGTFAEWRDIMFFHAESIPTFA